MKLTVIHYTVLVLVFVVLFVLKTRKAQAQATQQTNALPNMTNEEQAVGIKRDSDFFPNESHVMKVAEKWSFDPTKLSAESGGKGVGWLGNL